jgi:hypothetical protein
MNDQGENKNEDCYGCGVSRKVVMEKSSGVREFGCSGVREFGSSGVRELGAELS